MAKKQRTPETEEANRSLLNRVFGNKALTIGTGLVIVAVFAGAAILVVTLLGGDELSQDEPRLAIPAPVGPPPDIGRSAAADVLANKSWDEMTSAERELVESEVKRVFDDSTFRARNFFVPAIDIFRKDGATQVSRSYSEYEAPGGKDTATQIVFYCKAGNGSIEAHSYLVASLRNLVETGNTDEFPVAWSPIMTGTGWSSVADLGFRDADGIHLHGLELDFTLPSGTNAGIPRRVQYWFDVETARLMERGQVLEGDPGSTEANWYRLRYDQLPPPEIPADLEKPECVQDILATIAP